MPRPKQFDPDEALERAMRVFWERGYEATSVEDLTQALGINRFSLYASFGDKHALFVKGVERYTKQVFERTLAELRTGPEGLAAIERYFVTLARWAETPNGRNGCLLVNTATERSVHDRALTRLLRERYDAAESAFLLALTRAEASGELRAGLVLPDQARKLVLLAHGALVSMKVLRERDWIESSARAVIADLGRPSRASARR